MFKPWIVLVFLVCISFSFNRTEAYTIKSELFKSFRNYPRIVQTLIEEDLYFTSIPLVKEYLVNINRVDNRQVDLIIDQIAQNVGIKQFEILPNKILNRSSSQTLKYILARKQFRKGKYNTVLKTIANIKKDHPVAPFVAFLRASSLSMLNRSNQAIREYNECTDLSNKRLSSAKSKTAKRQLLINRDYCIVGVSRVQFANGQYEKANLQYLDLEKSSFIWPEILFEEAWNSFYLKDYNRTLGKLVTYKAPVMDFYFNPEVEVLRALTFLELCLYNDSQKVVDNYFEKYERDYARVRRYLKKYRKKYRHFYLLAKSAENKDVSSNKLLRTYLKAVLRDPSYQEMYANFQDGKYELEKLNKAPNSKSKRVLILNLKESLIVQRDLIGSYVYRKLQKFNTQLDKNLQGMSYIKLELLSLTKKSLYASSSFQDGRDRGDIANISRSDKQYFWNFNGEFWADELGDYVFSLKSECN